jgi:multidrug efflux pump subunit AcrA (membrane-fusion protein)
VILEKPPPKVESEPATSPLRPPGPSRHPRRRRALVLVLVLVVLVGLLAARLLAARPQASPAVQGTQTAPLVAHGQILPSRQARVGTLNGGVVQQLNVGVGSEVARQVVVAWVLGPTGTEVVTAPFRGTVSNVLVHEGDTVSPGAALVVVADLQSLQLELADVDEFLVSHLRLGQVLQVTVDALDDAPVEGVVSSIALLPQAAASTATAAYPVTLSLSGLPPEVRAGMSARVTLN